MLGGAGNFKDGDDYTDEERKMMFETRKILEAPDIGISVTCARVPVIAAHSESVNLQTRDAIEPDAVRELLRGAPGVEVVDDPASNGYPTALAGAGRDEVLVGRIRRDPSHPRALNLWVVGDNLLKGAATNADPDRRGAARARPRARAGPPGRLSARRRRRRAPPAPRRAAAGCGARSPRSAAVQARGRAARRRASPCR